jgi:AcrR family transcriptional regulator
LLAAARTAFEERGYRATTVAHIVEGASTARGTFYLYFRNREDAFVQMLARAIDDLHAEAGGHWRREDPEGSVAAATRAYLEGYAARRRLWRCTLQAALDSPAIAALWLEHRRHFIDRIAHNLRRGQAERLYRPLDPDLAARALGAMVEWFAFTTLVLGEYDVESDGLERASETLAGMWLSAVTR